MHVLCLPATNETRAYILAVTMNLGPIRYTGRFGLMYLVQSITIVTSVRPL